MPRRAPRPCSQCAIRMATQSGRCEECADKTPDYHDGRLRPLYSSPRWRQARRLFLTRHPLCHECEDEGVFTPATTVDHTPPHCDDEARFWDESTWRAKCKRHHDTKTRREMGELTASRR